MKYILLITLSLFSLPVLADTCHEITMTKEAGPTSIVDAAKQSGITVSEAQSNYVFGNLIAKVLVKKVDIKNVCVVFESNKGFQVGSTVTDYRSDFTEIPKKYK